LHGAVTGGRAEPFGYETVTSGKVLATGQ